MPELRASRLKGWCGAAPFSAWLELAEGVGFETTAELPPLRFSRPVP